MSFDQAVRSFDAPCLPPGATLHSLATYIHRSSGSKNSEHSCLQCYGLPKTQLEGGNPLGQGAQHLAEKFFGGKPSGVELIHRHTLLGLFGPVMPEAWWGNRHLEAIADGVSTRKFASGRRFDKPMSWCPDCCRDDFRKLGWTPWRVVHQVPFAHHCPDHGTPLLATCSFCHKAVDHGFQWRLPGDPCTTCHGVSFLPAHAVDPSRGYQRLLRVLSKLNQVMSSQGSMATAESFPWERGMPSLSMDWQTVSDRLCTEWALDRPEHSIPQCLGTREKPAFLQTARQWPELASALAMVLFNSLRPEFA